MKETPLACTLTASDLRDRERAWLRLATFGTAAIDIPGGVRLDFRAAPGVADSLTTLIDLEAECCPWMEFSTAPSSGAMSLMITAAGTAGETAVRLAFTPLTSLLSSAGAPPQTRPIVP